MSKYEPLWEHVKADGREQIVLSFGVIGDVLGFDLDHSFLNYKKELLEYGYQVGKISMKEKTVIFTKSASE